MPRLFVFDCPKCKYKTVKKVEFIQPSNARVIDSARYVIDLSISSEHNGYPKQIIECPECETHITSEVFELSKIPPVYFNYMGDD